MINHLTLVNPVATHELPFLFQLYPWILKVIELRHVLLFHFWRRWWSSDTYSFRMPILFAPYISVCSRVTWFIAWPMFEKIDPMFISSFHNWKFSHAKRNSEVNCSAMKWTRHGNQERAELILLGNLAKLAKSTTECCIAWNN